METIRTWCISLLKERVHAASEDKALKPLAFYATDSSLPQRIIRAARKNDVPELLPLAFYSLATTTMNRTAPPAFDILSDVDHDDLVRILVGRERLTAIWKEFSLKSKVLGLHFSVPCPNAGSAFAGATCSIGKEANVPFRVDLLFSGGTNPLKYLLEGLNGSPLAMCGACKAENERLCEMTAKRVFAQLPVIFDL